MKSCIILTIKALILFFLVSMPLFGYAQSNRTHIVQSGETLASIAAQYGISEDVLIKDNPSAAGILYPGMELSISSSASSTSLNLTSEGVKTTDYDASDYSRDFNISDFAYFAASYSATFDYPEYGYYGIGGEAFGPGGFGFSLFVGANFGIIDPATVTMLIGPTYGYAVSEHFAVSCPLELGASICSYDKKDHWAFAWRLVPKALLKFGRLSIIGGFPITYDFSLKQMGFGWAAGIGIDL